MLAMLRIAGAKVAAGLVFRALAARYSGQHCLRIPVSLVDFLAAKVQLCTRRTRAKQDEVIYIFMSKHARQFSGVTVLEHVGGGAEFSGQTMRRKRRGRRH